MPSQALKYFSVVLAGLWLGLAGVIYPAYAAEDRASKPQPGNSGRTIVFQDESLDFELQRALGYSLSGGADVNECLFTAKRIIEGDDESWYREWLTTADRILAIAHKALRRGHRVSAREAFLRASNYYRAAEFYLHGHPEDPRILKTWGRSREAFRQAAALMDQPVEVVRIPYRKTTLPGYICRPDDSLRPRKTLIVQTGFDGTGEELYFETAFFALKRGYNVLIFEGPGQGGVIREQHLVFRPDWEKVVTPVVDFALTRPEFDSKRLVLMGISMGGYLAPRGAAFEHRLAALIANTGVYDMAQRHETWTDAQAGQARAKMKKEMAEVNKAVYQMMKKSTLMRWIMNNGMFTFGKDSPAEFLLARFDYNLRGLASKIRCPTLVVDNEGDIFFKGQARQLYNALTCSRGLMTFTRKDMAASHCQMGAMAISNQRILDWLDDTLTGK